MLKKPLILGGRETYTRMDNAWEEVLEKTLGDAPGEVLGVVLFGSYSSGGMDEYSDVDIAVIVSSDKPLRKYWVLRDLELDVLYIPRGFFDEVVVEAHDRVEYTLWQTHTLYLKILLEGKILYDPDNIVSEWMSLVENWKWTRREIRLALEYLYEDIDQARRLLEEEQFLEAIIALRDSIDLIVTIYALAYNEVPSPKPKDIYNEAVRYGLKKQYVNIQGLEENTRATLVFSYQYPRSGIVGCALRRVERELERGNNHLALLEARNLVLTESFTSMGKSIPQPYISQPKIELLARLKGWRRRLLEKLHGIENASPSTVIQGLEVVTNLIEQVRNRFTT